MGALWYNVDMKTNILQLVSPSELAISLGTQSKDLRLAKGWTRQTLASRAGVTPSSLKRFENTGKASLELVLKVAHALGRLSEFSNLFKPPGAQSIEELELRAGTPQTKRGRL